MIRTDCIFLKTQPEKSNLPINMKANRTWVQRVAQKRKRGPYRNSQTKAGHGMGGTSDSTESENKDGEAGPICQLIHNKLMSNRDL